MADLLGKVNRGGQAPVKIEGLVACCMNSQRPSNIARPPRSLYCNFTVQYAVENPIKKSLYNKKLKNKNPLSNFIQILQSNNPTITIAKSLY